MLVAREPGEVEPVAALPLHLRHARGTLLDPEVAHVPVALGGDDVADLAVVDPLQHLDVARLVAPLGAGDDGEVLLCGQVGGGDDRADADGIDRDRFLLHEDVLARLTAALKVAGRPGAGGAGDDEVDVGSAQTCW